MHIPALDSLRHERVGMITADERAVSMLVQAYVKTDATEERGAYDPIEGMARPFPYLINSTGAFVVEPIMNSGTLEELSDVIVEYTSYLYESAVNGEWVDELEEFDEERMTEQEQLLASGLLNFTANERPQTLWRILYEKANELAENDFEVEPSLLRENPLRDIGGRERYGFEYLPAIDEVDSWELKHTAVEKEVEGELIESESLWVRYERGDTVEERPILSYQNESTGYIAMSPNVSYGGDGMKDASSELITAILDGDNEYDSNLMGVSGNSLEGTRTLDYLENW